MSTKAEQLVDGFVSAIVAKERAWIYGSENELALAERVTEGSRACLLAYISQLEADRERLDFLEAQRKPLALLRDNCIKSDGAGLRTIRETIDAAAKQDAGTK